MAKRTPAKRAADALQVMLTAAKKIVAAEEAFTEAADAEHAERKARRKKSAKGVTL